DLDLAILDLQVVHRRLEVIGRDVQQLATHLARGVGDRARDAVGGLAAAARPSVWAGLRVALDDLDLVGRDAQDLGRDQDKAAVAAGDIDRADMDAHGAVVVDPTARRRRRRADRPATHGDPNPLAGLAILPCRVLTHALQAFFQAQAGPGIAIAHQIAGLGGVAIAEFQRIDTQIARHVVDVRFEGKGGRRRTRRAVGARLRLVGEDLEAVDLDVLALVVAAQENADDAAEGEG